MWIRDENLLVQLKYMANGGKKYNSPCKKDITIYNNMKANTIIHEDTKVIKYSATVIMKRITITKMK